MVHNPVNTAIAFVMLVALVGGSFYFVHATTPYLGIEGNAITPAIARELGLQEEKGLLIFFVKPGSPADVAGLKGGDRKAVISGQEWAIGGDIITAIDGVKIQGVDDAEKLLSNKKLGDTVKFTVTRASTHLDINVTIGGGG